MTDRRLRADLLKKLGVTKQRLSQLVADIKRKCPMTTEDATYCIAHREGIKLDKYLHESTVVNIRTLLLHLQKPVGAEGSVSKRPKAMTRTREVRIGGKISITDPILPERAINEASEMANKVYPMLYVFENSVRDVIQRMLNSKYPSNWWDKAQIPSEVRAKVLGRQAKETKEPWHGRRGAHPIFYTDIEHLVRIVQSNWPVFKTLFPSQEWFSHLVDCMASSRNPVAHMNPIGRHDIARVKINLSDWQRLVAAKRHLLVQAGKVETAQDSARSNA